MMRFTKPFFDKPSLAYMRTGMQSHINHLQEFIQFNNFKDRLKSDKLLAHATRPGSKTIEQAMADHPEIIDPAKAHMALDAALATFVLHVESRITSLLGRAFYTIGPCGEEMIAPVGLVLKEDDPMALHYRHLAASISRQLKCDTPMEEIMLNRARGYVVAQSDPVTGGRHCALGGGQHDYIVTSTLASQTSPAVGRALGGSLAHMLGVPCHFSKNYCSFVSQGDGSVNNGHFLSGENLAEFAAFNKFRCPIVFCITDNGLSISLKNNGYFQKNFIKKLQMPVYFGDGKDIVSSWIATHKAVEFARDNKKPCALAITNITRRFGHAATDRQLAYLSKEEIQRMAETDNLIHLCAQMVESKLISQKEIVEKVYHMHEICQEAFEKANAEMKIESREDAFKYLQAPLVSLSEPFRLYSTEAHAEKEAPHALMQPPAITGTNAKVMRKHMNHVFDELLTANKNCVYLGEDVTHGGYYIVTENLSKKHPFRVQDFPPDETSIIGVGMGYYHAGLLPIVEIPYAKYLDCGMDMFTEASIMSWLSNGKQPNGMIIRLQGFGRGVFGGNYHTHNMLHMPPGIDVVCYSNGANYAMAMRYALEQAKKGRIIMFVDCTELLNMREVAPGVPWEYALTPSSDFVTFDEVFISRRKDAATKPKLCVVTYGNGVPAAISAQQKLGSEEQYGGIEIDVLDCPLLSSVPVGLSEVTKRYDHVLFADPCKQGQNPLANHLTSLLNDGLLPASARMVCAPRTYNPLGNTLTFLNDADIIGEVQMMLGKK